MPTSEKSEMTTERQRCPRRGESVVFGRSEEALPDTWRRDRWKNTKEEADAEVAAFLAKWPRSSMGDPQWHGASPQPRTCSYCGGIHPDDAIQLLREGWEVVATDKGYKRYLEPGGSRMRHDVLMRRLREREPDPLKAVPSVWSPLPPVKLYVQHFDEASIAAFNALLTGAPDAD